MRTFNFRPGHAVRVGAIDFGTVQMTEVDGFPKSGSADSLIDHFGNSLAAGSLVVDKNTGVVFINEGTAAASYWTPVNFQQRGLLGWYEDFRDGVGKALADTAATATKAGTGLRIHGQGVAENDSGVVVSMDEGGPVATLTTTDEDEHTLVLSFGTGTSPLFQPDQNQVITFDAIVAQKTAITLRAFFFGFCGSAADALDPVANGATVTISFADTIADDIAGFFQDVGLTDADGIFCIHDKGNANASIATTATGVDPSVTMAAAGTYQRFRVEVDADGAVRMFVNKALVASFAAGTLDVDEEIHPVLQLISESAAVKECLVKQIAAWGKRP